MSLATKMSIAEAQAELAKRTINLSTNSALNRLKWIRRNQDKQNLSNQNIKLNITAVYNAKQTKKILSTINKKSKVIISIFAGRAADTGKDPIPEFKKSIALAKKYKNVEILWASVREPYNYIQAKQIGCHIITVPPSIIEKIEKFGKSFQQLTTDTVKGFLVDTKKSKFKI